MERQQVLHPAVTLHDSAEFAQVGSVRCDVVEMQAGIDCGLTRTTVIETSVSLSLSVLQATIPV